MTDIRAIHGGRNTSRGSTVLWGIQTLLALLFLFAGGMKLAMPAATLAQPLVVGVLAGFLARRRWNWIAPAPDARRAAEPSPRRAAARTRPAEAA